MSITALIAVALAANVTGTAQTQIPKYRTATGTVQALAYSEDFDRVSCLIETTDGHAWTVSDYIAPRDASVLVTFDTQGTADVTDDAIVCVLSGYVT